jgi:creatinine amidohydrolase
METEVRYHMLRPAQIVERRKACPIAYIPLGTIEWHGLHNPTGTDGLLAEHLANRCAEKGGGLAFPPLYYGESRLNGMMEAKAVDRDKIAEKMELPPENFELQRMPFAQTEQDLNYFKLLVHILAEVESLGFSVGIFVAGHYPLLECAREAILLFNRRDYRPERMLAWAFADYLLLKDEIKFAGDHAAGWETSHVMAIHPQAVDISLLPPKGTKLIGVGGDEHAKTAWEASPELGAEMFEKAVDVAIKEARHRLDNKASYLRIGFCLKEGLWKNDAAK